MKSTSTQDAEDATFANVAQLLHTLNQRYRHEWDRAERYRAELENLHASRIWRLLCLVRRVKCWFLPSNIQRPEPACFSTTLVAPQPLRGDEHVSIVIPFKDAVGLLQPLLASIAVHTARPHEIVLLDNGSTCPATLRYLKELEADDNVRVLACPGPFNYARLCNRGAHEARGNTLLFLNNDMLVRSPDWLEALLALAAHPRVEIVGATLLYPDGTLQHAGVYPEAEGAWTHRHRGWPGDYPGTHGELREPHTVPAVTGACLMMRRDRFLALGGFREDLPVTGNDVDLCCRVHASGGWVVLTPHARLLHYESMSRGYAVDGYTSENAIPF